MKSSKTIITLLKRLDELNFHQQPYKVAILILSKHIIKGISFQQIIVKLRQGSGKDRQGMAVKAKGLKA